MTDAGYFPRGASVLRRVHEERAVGLLYGQRALAIGAMDARNFVGTANHTRSPAKPFDRLVLTAKMFETIQFGTRAEADRVLAAVHRMHSAVNGELTQDAGPHPAGTAYSAHDPELMLWTIAVAADSALFFYELLVGPLADHDRDLFWDEYVTFGELFGMPREVAPVGWDGFREWFDGRLEGPASYLTRDARYVGSSVLLHIPVPLSRMPAMKVHNLVMIGSLPRSVRAAYRLRWTPAHALAYAGAVTALRASTRVAPSPARRGSCKAQFDLVARTERERLASGRPVRGALA